MSLVLYSCHGALRYPIDGGGRGGEVGSGGGGERGVAELANGVRGGLVAEIKRFELVVGHVGELIDRYGVGIRLVVADEVEVVDEGNETIGLVVSASVDFVELRLELRKFVRKEGGAEVRRVELAFGGQGGAGVDQSGWDGGGRSDAENG